MNENNIKSKEKKKFMVIQMTIFEYDDDYQGAPAPDNTQCLENIYIKNNHVKNEVKITDQYARGQVIKSIHH